MGKKKQTQRPVRVKAWRIFQTTAGRRFLMGLTDMDAVFGPLDMQGLDPDTMGVVGAAAVRLAGPPAYDDRVQYHLETGWDVERQAQDVTVMVCREHGVAESLIAAYERDVSARRRGQK